jgi:hypothetical protein
MNKATLLSGNTRPGTRALASSSSKHNTPASFESSSTFRTCFLTHRRDEHQTRMEKHDAATSSVDTMAGTASPDCVTVRDTTSVGRFFTFMKNLQLWFFK